MCINVFVMILLELYRSGDINVKSDLEVLEENGSQGHKNPKGFSSAENAVLHCIQQIKWQYAEFWFGSSARIQLF